MKTIELIEDQRSQLLEMCEILFPEYNIDIVDKIADNITLNHTFIEYDQNIIFNEDADLEEIVNINHSIHWFEFASIYLLQKLSYELYKRGISCDHKKHRCSNLWVEYNYVVSDYNLKGKKLHPIDYLYNEFKKIK